jgi:hypothetical protein
MDDRALRAVSRSDDASRESGTPQSEDGAPGLSVLFIGGHSRSGSTLLSRILGKEPSVVSVGELIFIGDRGYRDNQLCSCGQPFRECQFWAQVVSVVGGGSPDAWFARLVYLKSTLARIRYVPGLALGRALAPATQVAEYVGMLDTVVAAVAAVAAVDTVIDSSKHPPYGFFLSRCKSFDLYSAHLIRDPRAVAFSQQRRRVRPEIRTTTEIMPRFSPARTAFDWSLVNTLMQVLGQVAGRYQRIRYEDLVGDPDGASRALLRWVGAPAVLAPDQGQRLCIGHELSGNPMRLQPAFNVTLDAEWMTSMSVRDMMTVSAISAPLLVNYGYDLTVR